MQSFLPPDSGKAVNSNKSDCVTDCRKMVAWKVNLGGRKEEKREIRERGKKKERNKECGHVGITLTEQISGHYFTTLFHFFFPNNSCIFKHAH